MRACVSSGYVWGCAVGPISPETWASTEPGSKGWTPSPANVHASKGRWISPHISQPRSSGDLCTPKALQCPWIPFLPQSFFLEALPGFPAGLHYLFALLITSVPICIHPAFSWCQGPETLRTLSSLGHPQARSGRLQSEISLGCPELSASRPLRYQACCIDSIWTDSRRLYDGHRELRLYVEWKGAQVKGDKGWALGGTLGTLLQALLDSGGQKEYQAVYP